MKDNANNRMFTPDGTLQTLDSGAAQTLKDTLRTSWDNDSQLAANTPQTDGLTLICPE